MTQLIQLAGRDYINLNSIDRIFYDYDGVAYRIYMYYNGMQERYVSCNAFSFDEVDVAFSYLIKEIADGVKIIYIYGGMQNDISYHKNLERRDNNEKHGLFEELKSRG